MGRSGVYGAGGAGWRGTKLAFLGLVLAGVWIPTLVRGVGYVGFWHVYLPVARYAGPAIIPTALVLSLGWMEIVYLFEGSLAQTIKTLFLPPEGNVCATDW